MEESFWKYSFFVLLLIWFFIRGAYRQKSLKAKVKQAKDTIFEKLLVVANFVSMMFLPTFAVFSTLIDFASMGLPQLLRWLALIIYFLNIIFFTWCHKSLGKYWAMGLEIKKNHHLVQEGPYKKIRHPMYTHFWLLILCQSLVLNNWIVLIYGVIAWGTLYFLRVNKEEEMMIKEFGDEYKEYIKKTGRLFPKIS